MLQTEVQLTYPSDLTDCQWSILEKHLPCPRTCGRPRKNSYRSILNAIFYLNRTGCGWRYIPKDFPHWRTVYDYFRKWQRDGTLDTVHSYLVGEIRVKNGRDRSPSRCAIDSQACKAQWGEERGYDGFKKVRGRKRNIVVDTLGLIHMISIDSAYIKDHKSALELFTDVSVPQRLPRLKEVYADGGYKPLKGNLEILKGPEVILNISKRKMEVQGKDQNYRRKNVLKDTNLKPVRWVVERTFAWFNHFRRLARDYERSIQSSIAMIFISMIRLMLDRLTKKKKERWE